MNILIKGMEMPKDCIKCPFCLFADGQWKCLVDGSHADFGGTCRPQRCPLVPVQKHGRLIDADWVRNDIDEKRPGRIYEDAWALTIIEYAPTIIPASEEDE